MRRALILALAGCGAGGEEAGPDGGDASLPCSPEAPTIAECGPGETPSDGACRAVGPGPCADGWAAAEGGGCNPILPAFDCGEAEMPLLGESECAPVRACGGAPWGNVAPEDGALFVSAAYEGGDSDGSEARPFSRVQDAVDAASPGAQIVVLAGEYVESVVVTARVRIEGRCPALVTLRGAASDAPALDVRWDQVEVRGLRVTGPAWGVVIAAAAQEVVAEEIVVEGCGLSGVVVQQGASAALRRVLARDNGDSGVRVVGASALIEDIAALDGASGPGGVAGMGISIEADPETGAPAEAEVRRVVALRNRTAGVLVFGATATLDDLVVGDTAPQEADGLWGRGIDVEAHPLGAAADATIRRAWLAENRDAGLFAGAATVAAEDLVVADTAAGAASDGDDATLEAFAGVRATDATLTLARGLVAASEGFGVFALRSAVTLADTIVRDTRATPLVAGSGVGALAVGDGASLSLRGAVVERNTLAGVAVSGARATIDGSAVRDTEAEEDAPGWGVGVAAQIDPASGAAADLTLRTSAVEGCSLAGVVVAGATATIADVAVRRTRPAAGPEPYGDGIVVMGDDAAPAAADVLGATVEGSARAGLLFYGAGGSLSRAVLRGNRFGVALDAGADPELSCNSQEDNGTDMAVGQGLAPPPALPTP